MRHAPRPEPCVARRALLGTAALATLPRLASAAEVEPLLREGGVVIAFRHALAPGTFDPPEFRLGDCRTQRNLSDGGRAQARRRPRPRACGCSSSSKSSASFSSIVPPSCSASTIVTARR